MRNKVIFTVLLFFGFLFMVTSAFAATQKCLLTPNQAYKYKGNAAVYLITSSCTKQAFRSSTMFFQYFKSWSQVKVVAKTTLAKIVADKNVFVFSKKGCNYYNPVCDSNQACVKNQCVTNPNFLTGCAYGTSACAKNYICIQNKCVINQQGCFYHNPDCGVNYTCLNNQCFLKQNTPPGCSYNNPACGSDYNCVNNQCVSKQSTPAGCAYNNPVCENGYSCVNNSCQYNAVGCQWSNPACGADSDCVNNQCVPKQSAAIGCSSNNPVCQVGHVCSSNLCVLKSQATLSDYSWTGIEDTCGDGICDAGDNLCPIDCDPKNAYTTTVSGPVTVEVPKGYEQLGAAYSEDLKNCIPLLKKFLTITPRYNKIFLRMTIGDTTSGSSDGRGVFYQKTADNANQELQEIKTNGKDGFLYNSSANYCASTHEVTHIFTNRLQPMMPMLVEGIAEYSQKINQAGSKDYLECRDAGVYRQDIWGDNKYKVFPYVALGENNDWSNPVSNFYASGMCFWEYIDTKYGRQKFQEVIKRYSEVADLSNEPMSKLQVRRFLFDKVLIPVLGSQIEMEIEARFGFDDKG